MANDGNGIDVEKHPEHNLWIPEMIFGHLRTSTNYDKQEKKIVGGKNGFGFKLVLIWSEWGSVETFDHIRKKKYTQNFRDNLNVIEPPTITKGTGKPYTKVTFKPDYKRLGLVNLTDNMRAMFERRVYDIAAVTDKRVVVKLNGVPIQVKKPSQTILICILVAKTNANVFTSKLVIGGSMLFVLALLMNIQQYRLLMVFTQQKAVNIPIHYQPDCQKKMTALILKKRR